MLEWKKSLRNYCKSLRRKKFSTRLKAQMSLLMSTSMVKNKKILRLLLGEKQTRNKVQTPSQVKIWMRSTWSTLNLKLLNSTTCPTSRSFSHFLLMVARFLMVLLRVMMRSLRRSVLCPNTSSSYKFITITRVCFTLRACTCSTLSRFASFGWAKMSPSPRSPWPIGWRPML